MDFFSAFLVDFVPKSMDTMQNLTLLLYRQWRRLVAGTILLQLLYSSSKCTQYTLTAMWLLYLHHKNHENVDIQVYGIPNVIIAYLLLWMGGCHFPEFPFPCFKPDGRLTIWDVWAVIETEFSLYILDRAWHWGRSDELFEDFEFSVRFWARFWVKLNPFSPFNP